MIKRMSELNKLIDFVNFDQLWNGFSKSKYAIYNDKYFYINDDKGLNLELKKDEFGFIGKVDERFIGNSAISINNENIAIWDQRTIYEGMENEKLASVVIHEMFHCFQAQYGEKRYANEILGIEYPIEINNISLRSQERKFLYNAIFESDKLKKYELLKQFFNIRSRREELIGDFINYEKGIETFEGPAVFVEFQALSQLSANKNRLELLKEYTDGFADISIDNLAIRRSSYNQGMLLCLIAEDIAPGWKRKYQESPDYLSDFILNELNFEVYKSGNNLIPSNEVIECLEKWSKKRDAIFEEFENSSEKLFVNGGVQITGFDPMNIVKREKELIHKSFLRVLLGNKEQVINGPVKTIIGDNVFDVKRMEWLK